jgi:hypothetical protein
LQITSGEKSEHFHGTSRVDRGPINSTQHFNSGRPDSPWHLGKS